MRHNHTDLDCWRDVIGNVIAAMLLEVAYCEQTGSPKSHTAGRSCAGAKLMAWRLLRRNIQPVLVLRKGALYECRIRQVYHQDIPQT